MWILPAGDVGKYQSPLGFREGEREREKRQAVSAVMKGTLPVMASLALLYFIAFFRDPLLLTCSAIRIRIRLAIKHHLPFISSPSLSSSFHLLSIGRLVEAHKMESWVPRRPRSLLARVYDSLSSGFRHILVILKWDSYELKKKTRAMILFEGTTIAAVGVGVTFFSTADRMLSL